MNSLEMNNIEEIKTLNPYQQEAVLDESPACLVNANVGSGKTTVLIEKVRHLHEKKQVSYEKMAVLTFTNKAADEIAEPCGELSKSPKIQHFFKFCLTTSDYILTTWI